MILKGIIATAIPIISKIIVAMLPINMLLNKYLAFLQSHAAELSIKAMETIKKIIAIPITAGRTKISNGNAKKKNNKATIPPTIKLTKNKNALR